MTASDPRPERAFLPIGIAVLTISNSRALADDKSGDTLAARIAEAGHTLAARALVKDDVTAIRRQIRAWLKEPAIDAIISTGGTGLTGHDVTVEAMRPLFEKEIEGFSVAFHMVSFGKIGTSTVQSRATAGVAKGKYVFCLPGSPGACRDGWDHILRDQLDYRHMPCNFVEIMPRLEEHLRRRKL
jgi:molybdenum cofactor biosynthesis protein B